MVSAETNWIGAFFVPGPKVGVWSSGIQMLGRTSDDCFIVFLDSSPKVNLKGIAPGFDVEGLSRGHAEHVEHQYVRVGTSGRKKAREDLFAEQISDLLSKQLCIEVGAE